MLLFSCFNKSYPRHLCQGDASKINYWFLFSSSHFVLLPEDGKKKEVFLSSAWKTEKFVLLLQVCRGWNEAFHMPELWRCFEFELNQPASSYLKATHPDLIKQIIKRHSDHLQYVSFKVRKRGGQFEVTAVQWSGFLCAAQLTVSFSLCAARWTAAESLQKQRATSSLSWWIVLWKLWGSSPQPGPASWRCLRSASARGSRRVHFQLKAKLRRDTTRWGVSFAEP